MRMSIGTINQNEFFVVFVGLPKWQLPNDSLHNWIAVEWVDCNGLYHLKRLR